MDRPSDVDRGTEPAVDVQIHSKVPTFCDSLSVAVDSWRLTSEWLLACQMPGIDFTRRGTTAVSKSGNRLSIDSYC